MAAGAFAASARTRFPIAMMDFVSLIASRRAKASLAVTMAVAVSVASAVRGMSAWKTTAAHPGVVVRLVA